MSGDLGTIVSRIRKNKAETAIVRLVEFHGTPCIDLRVFIEGEDGQDVPTKKGLALNVRLIPDLIAALQEAQAASDREGVRQRQTDNAMDARLLEGRHVHDAPDEHEYGMRA